MSIHRTFRGTPDLPSADGLARLQVFSGSGDRFSQHFDHRSPDVGWRSSTRYERAAEVINFGAFLAFMGVNAAAIRESGVPSWRQAARLRWAAIVPLCGVAFCAAIWLGLPAPAKIIGRAWFAAGLIYNAVRTRGFRTAPVSIDLSEA